MANANTPRLEAALAEGLATLTFSDIPPELVKRTGLFVLDNFGVMLGASKAPAMAELHRSIQSWESNGRATILINGLRVSPASAALANGSAAHALDYDDQHDSARIHTLCTVLPAALAAAEDVGKVSGREFLRAVIVGAEFSSRLGLCCPQSLELGCHPTAALGGLAAAAAAALIYDLDSARMLNAIAIAFVQMGGTTQSNIDGALTKRMGAGFAARNGVVAAHMARSGLSGPSRFLEGKAGLFQFYQRGNVIPGVLLDRLGQRWMFDDLSTKPFPCCRASHAAIQIGLDLHQDDIHPDAIDSIEIRLGHVNWMMVGAPFNPIQTSPVVHAQFNAAYAFAEAVRYGAVGLETFDTERIMGADRQFIQRISCIDAPEIDGASVAGVVVSVKMRDGTTIRRQKDTVKGSPQEPMSQEEIISKFRACVAFGIGGLPASIDSFIDLVLHLDDLDEVDTLITAFPKHSDSRQAAGLQFVPT